MNFIKGLESLLEQVDQTAQKLAHKEDGTDADGSSPSGAVRNPADGAGGRTSGAPSAGGGRIQAQSRSATKPRSDDEIFAFLNTPVSSGAGSTSTPSSPVRAPTTAATSASAGRGTKTAPSSASSTRSRPLTGSGATRGKPAVKPTVRKLGTSTSTATTPKPGDATASGATAAAASEGGTKPSSPKKEKDGGSDEEKPTKTKKATQTKGESRRGTEAEAEAGPQASSSGVVADTSDADTEKEPSEEQQQQKLQHEPPSAATSPTHPAPAQSSESAMVATGPDAAVVVGAGQSTYEGDSANASTSGADDAEEQQTQKSDGGEREAGDRDQHQLQAGREKEEKEQQQQQQEEEDDDDRTGAGESEGDATSGGNHEEEQTRAGTGDRHDDQNEIEEEREEVVEEEDGKNEGEGEADAGEGAEEEEEEEEVEEAYDDRGEERTKHLEEQVETLLNEGTKLKMENKLMRSEVRALNDEVTSLTERITGEHEALERANDALHALQMEVLDKDRQLMRLRKQEDEFDAVLAKKDAQHAALQVKLEETSLHVTGLEQTANALKQEIDRLHREKDETNDLHKQSIALINAKIVELEDQLKEERESASSQRSLALERERNLESDISEYTKALGQAQRAIEDKNKQVEKHMSTIKELEANVQGLKQELTDYKLRAKKVLQQRETTIQELTEKLTSPAGATNAEEGELQEKWKELMLQKQAYESLKNEFDETRDELNKIKQNLAQTQEQAEHDALEFEEQVKALEDELEREKEKVKKMQFELAQKMQELHTAKDQQNQATNGLKEQVKERDAQIAKLKRQITVKGIQSQSSSQAELESSLSAMTDRLIRLQALNETLTNEKAALQMRLNSEVQSRREREGVRRSGEVDMKHSSGDITSIIINTGAEPAKSGPRLRSIASLVPESWSGDPESKRHQVYTHTLRAASALDNFTAQVGRILRRNPLARLLLILYMVFLHVWVLFLLSRPLEIHDMMDESLPPGAVPPTGLPHGLVHSDSPAAAGI